MVSLNGAGAIARYWNGVACFVGIPRHGRRKNDWASQVYGGAERGARVRFRERLGTGEILSKWLKRVCSHFPGWPFNDFRLALMVETPCPSDEIVMWSVLESVERSIMKKEKGCGWMGQWVDGWARLYSRPSQESSLLAAIVLSSWPLTGHHR